MGAGGKSNMADLLVLRMAQRVTLQSDEVNFARTRIWRHS